MYGTAEPVEKLNGNRVVQAEPRAHMSIDLWVHRLQYLYIVPDIAEHMENRISRYDQDQTENDQGNDQQGRNRLEKSFYRIAKKHFSESTVGQ